MAQQLRVPTTLAEDLGSILSALMTTHNHLVTPVPGDLLLSSGFHRLLCACRTHTLTQSNTGTLK